ncbi:Glucokinase [Geodia barretti]|uniref:Glucokinase n=1 Tax=Geodia barretti TaxID=519541 RepID=A0AA35WR76_GEOBA|nr:Glucokinase [Geodia barretti]
MTEYALVADVGGTRTRVALVDATGGIVVRHSTETLARQGRDAVMNRLADALEHVASERRTEIKGVGLSLASPVEPGTGVMYNPPNLGPEWHLFTPIPILRERLSLPVYAENDATLGALGEHAFGAGRGCDNMVYMTVSTGIGGGIIIDGNLYTGTNGFGAEIGHMTIDQNGPLDNCGNGPVAGERSVMIEFAGGDIAAVDARIVVQAAHQDDALAQSLMQEVGRSLASGIISLMHIFDPQLIVIGGGLGQNLDMFMPTIEPEVKRRAMAHFQGAVPVAKSQLGDDVSLLGAAALVFKEA